MNLEQAIQSSGFKNEKQKAALNIMYTAYQIKTIVSQTLKDFGLTPEQFNVLRILKGKYPDQMCVRDIGQRMVERSSNVPRIIDRLEIKKLVKRSQSGDDKRETAINLTQAGTNLLDMVNPVVEKSQDSITALQDVELQQLNSLLDAFLKD
jgi:DNA-binding MarR family transcriptional regulator